MILVSSFRPFDDCPRDIWGQQIAANRSWTRLFDRIFYFNNRDQRMTSNKTLFIPTTGRPSIRQMANFCGQLNDWSCIVNADIVISTPFRRVEEALRGRQSACAVSRRYTMPEDGEISGSKITDLGLDFFAATPTVWKKAGEKIPQDFQIGRINWDNWMVNFFMAEFGNYCYDITPAKVIFHPQHEDRRDQNWDVPKDNFYLTKNNWPFHTIDT